MSRDPFNDREQTKRNVDDMKERVSDLTSRVKDKASHFAEVASERLDHQRETAAGNLNRMASTLHEKAGSVPGGTNVVNFTHRIANGMESTATYLRDHDFAAVGQDALKLCRRYPAQSIISALAVGFLLGRARR